MKNEQQAEMTMFAAVKAELTEDAGIYSGNAPFVAAKNVFGAAYEKNLVAAAAAFPDNTGYSTVKKELKTKLSKMASNLSGKAFVALKIKNEPEIAELLNIYPTDYISLSDSACGALAQGAYNIMNENIGDLDGYVAAEDLEDLKTLTDEFINAQGSSELQHEISPELTDAFYESFKPVKEAIGTLKLLVRDYESSNIDFYNRFMASTIVPAVAVRHTYVTVHAVWKNSEKPAEGIVIKLSNSTKTTVTDWEGNGTLKEVKAGKALLSGELASKVKFEAHIEIKRGTTNHYEAVIEEEGV
jgi:hypothetical protein